LADLDVRDTMNRSEKIAVSDKRSGDESKGGGSDKKIDKTEMGQ